MIHRRAVVALGLFLLIGCEPRKVQKQVGPLRDWIVGSWMRTDDRVFWNFSADGEMITSGRVPIGGSYSTEEPNKVLVLITGANALSAAAQLGLAADENKNLKINFVVQDDEMKVVGVNSTVVFQKK
jgi:hypothetical protein